MEKQDAVNIMNHLAGKVQNIPAIEDLVAAYAEFLAHIQPLVDENDFAFLATVGAVIYRKGSRQYNSVLETEFLMQKLQITEPSDCPRKRNVESTG